MDLPPSLMVSVTIAARMLGVSRSTAYDLINRGEFPVTPRRVGSRLMINREHLEAWCRGEQTEVAS